MSLLIKNVQTTDKTREDRSNQHLAIGIQAQIKLSEYAECFKKPTHSSKMTRLLRDM